MPGKSANHYATKVTIIINRWLLPPTRKGSPTIHTTCNSRNLALCNRPSKNPLWLSQTTSYPQVHLPIKAFTFLTRPNPHHIEVHASVHTSTQCKHKHNRPHLKATHISQSTPTFSHPMHSVYPAPPTYPSTYVSSQVKMSLLLNTFPGLGARGIFHPQGRPGLSAGLMEKFISASK